VITRDEARWLQGLPKFYLCELLYEISIGRMPFLSPNQQCKSTEGMDIVEQKVNKKPRATVSELILEWGGEGMPEGGRSSWGGGSQPLPTR